MTAVLLATFDLMPDGEPGAAALTAALDARGVESRWVRWDDPAVDWAGADLVAVRSTWDYHRRLPAFLDWARRVEAGTRLLNGAEVFAWNADKAYLVELADVVPTVPTRPLDDDALAAGLAVVLDRWGSVVVKPRTGAGGVGVVVAERADDPRLEGLVAGPWIAQPLVESVRTTGETSVFVFDGVAVGQVDKRLGQVAAAGEVRVNEVHGGQVRPVPLDPERAAVAEAAVAAAARQRRADLAYARVDLMVWADRWVVSELELIEPGLYLDVDPANAERFATLVAARLARS
ncbi:ATP-grasp domain-containing protein [Nocardioides sp. BYT-33-1]|uniref:ATP-grasp domain-containing protein n=1 Tax=Nocardioides sp. BYT-33-1 TaxID=3416952 RepID=UPI003F539D43